MQITDLTSELVDWQSLQKYWCKCLIIPMFSIYVNNIRILNISQVATGSYIEFIIVDIGFFVAEILSILYYALLLCTCQTFAAINAKLAAIMADANRINDRYSTRNESSHRMQQFCDLSDRLDLVAEMHYRWSSVAERLQRIFSASVTIWILNKTVAVIAHLFLMFVFTCKWPDLQTERDESKYPLVLLIYGGLLVGLFLVELFMLVKECTRATNEVYT